MTNRYFMSRAICMIVLPALLLAQEKAAAPQAAKSFPEPDFILRDKDLKPQKSGVVLGPMESDGKGGTKGSFAIYGGPSMVQVGSLSFSSDGKTLVPQPHLEFSDSKMWTLDHVKGYELRSPLLDLRAKNPVEREAHIAKYRSGFKIH